MMELVSEEQVINAVKAKGPVIPMDIRQIIKAGDSITIGATLSTLSDRGLVLITHLKRGGSPFYYVKGQEEKLADLSKYLNEKDRRTFEALRQNKILADKTEEPLTRISLRNIPDFAKSIALEINGVQEIFWRWYLVSEDEALSIIKGQSKEKKQEKTEKTESKESSKESLQKKEEHAQAKTEQSDAKEETSQEKKEKEIRKKDKEQPEKSGREDATEKDDFLQVTAEVQQKLEAGQNTQAISSFNDGFISKIGAYLSNGKIMIKETKQIKKGSEYDLVLDIPTPVGNVEYFCKAKSKKKCNEGDLSSAYVQGQNMRLPVLFLTTGEVVKKAKEKQKTDFKGMIIKEIN